MISPRRIESPASDKGVPVVRSRSSAMPEIKKDKEEDDKANKNR